jgi:hypothetical protein
MSDITILLLWFMILSTVWFLALLTWIGCNTSREFFESFITNVFGAIISWRIKKSS